MNEITRRRFLAFLGSGVAAATLASKLKIPSAWAQGMFDITNFTPVRLPHPLPIYGEQPSFLATGIDTGNVVSPTDPIALTTYTVVDDVVVPPEFERYVILTFGDRVFPNQDDYVGYNHDFIGFMPLTAEGTDGLLWVNHEYVSFPFSSLSPGAPDDLTGLPESFSPTVGFALPTEPNRELFGEMMYNIGGSLVHIQKGADGRFAVVAGDAQNKRVHGLSGLAINAERTDGFESITSWGTRPHQQGDSAFLEGTGPAASDVFTAVNSDGLGKRIIGTGFNCSGATTPWGTFLSGEENFQASESFFVGVTEAVKPDGTQTGYFAGSTGAEFGLVGEKYGWLVEVNPSNLNAKKHTALGRFRHENIALRVEAGSPLVAYMGDDRRGGHTWKFVSSGIVSNPTDANNSALFENGTLYVATFNADGTGEWRPLRLDLPTNPNVPSVIASVELAESGTAQRDGRVQLPQRAGLAGATEDGGAVNVEVTNEATLLPDYQGKTLADFYTSQGAVLCDAFLAANLIGGTPGARPEDIEIHPVTNEVFIAYTSAVPGSTGYPDSRIFVVGKYTADITDTQPDAGLYKIIEGSTDGTGTTFTWERFLLGGEAGAQDGTGFAALDNLVFDEQGNVFGVTDMSTSRHNGFRTGASAEPRPIDHTQTGDVRAINGVFGNNWLFVVPTSGPHAGKIMPFAYGPSRCEMTGNILVGDTMFLSVQHPGEDSPMNDGTAASMLNRDIEMLNLDGSLFMQNRTVPRGSNWPSNILGNPMGAPLPAMIGIRRRPTS